MNALITEILTAALAADPAHLQRAALACGAPDWSTLTARPLTPSVQDCGGGTQLLVADLSPRHQLCLGDRGRVPTGTARIYLAVYDRALGDELYWTRIEAGQVTARGGQICWPGAAASQALAVDELAGSVEQVCRVLLGAAGPELDSRVRRAVYDLQRGAAQTRRRMNQGALERMGR